MLTFIIRRILAGVVLLFVISVLAFGLLYLDSANIARRILGQNATPELVQQKAQELGLDRPIVVQYWDWLTSALTGDLGRSWFNGQLVTVSLSGRVAVTLSLVIGTTIVIGRSSPFCSASSPPAAGGVDRRRRPVHLGARLRDPGLPHRPLPRADLRDQPALVQGDRLHTHDGVVHRLAVVGDTADHRPLDRRHRRRHPAGPRLDARRAVARLRAHPPQPRAADEQRRLQARAAKRRRTRPRDPRRAVHRPPRRRRDRRAGLRPSRAWDS